MSSIKAHWKLDYSIYMKYNIKGNLIKVCLFPYSASNFLNISCSLRRLHLDFGFSKKIKKLIPESLSWLGLQFLVMWFNFYCFGSFLLRCRECQKMPLYIYIYIFFLTFVSILYVSFSYYEINLIQGICF